MNLHWLYCCKHFLSCCPVCRMFRWGRVSLQLRSASLINAVRDGSAAASHKRCASFSGGCSSAAEFGSGVPHVWEPPCACSLRPYMLHLFHGLDYLGYRHRSSRFDDSGFAFLGFNRWSRWLLYSAVASGNVEPYWAYMRTPCVQLMA